mmetsp:Transcript_16923/g.40255  ORF Transcript_16923/g.40255 Transcript_16923/m.40255 type:complete len:222 (+) Transcript_16923:1612-2277(+)
MEPLARKSLKMYVTSWYRSSPRRRKMIHFCSLMSLILSVRQVRKLQPTAKLNAPTVSMVRKRQSAASQSPLSGTRSMVDGGGMFVERWHAVAKSAESTETLKMPFQANAGPLGERRVASQQCRSGNLEDETGHLWNVTISMCSSSGRFISGSKWPSARGGTFVLRFNFKEGRLEHSSVYISTTMPKNKKRSRTPMMFTLSFDDPSQSITEEGLKCSLNHHC